MNYVTSRGTGLESILQSCIIAGSTTIFALAVGLMAAIGFSRYRAGSDRLAIAILAVRAVPPITLAIPALFLFTSVGLRDTYIGGHPRAHGLRRAVLVLDAEELHRRGAAPPSRRPA